MTDAYLQLMEQMKVAGIVRKHYDYSYKNAEVEFDNFYEYFNDLLQERAIRLNFPPSYMYFHDEDTINAGAYSDPNFKLLKFNYPCISYFYDFFADQEVKLQAPEFKYIRNLLDRLGNSYCLTFYQYYTIFLFFHEYAHLVQRAPGKLVDYEEFASMSAAATDILESHAIELDADWVASNAIGSYLTYFFKDAGGRFNGTADQISDLASIALASILCFFIIVAKSYPPLYFEEKTHPHPFIRIIYISTFIVKYIQSNVPHGLVIDSPSITKKAFDLAELMLEDYFFTAGGQIYAQVQPKEQEISDHINKIIDKVMTIPTLCYHRPADFL